MDSLMSLRMFDVLFGSATTIVVLVILRLIERRMGTVFIRGTPEDKLQVMEKRVQELTAKIETLETQTDFLIQTIIDCRAALEKEQAVRQYLSDRVAQLQGYRNTQATVPGTSDTDPLPPELEP